MNTPRFKGNPIVIETVLHTEVMENQIPMHNLANDLGLGYIPTYLHLLT